MKIKVTKGKETLNIDDNCLKAWENAGWKMNTTEKEVKASK